jgi:hypothetical protein
VKTAIDRKVAPETKDRAKKADAAVPHQAKQNEVVAIAVPKVEVPEKVVGVAQKVVVPVTDAVAVQKGVGQDVHPRGDRGPVEWDPVEWDPVAWALEPSCESCRFSPPWTQTPTVNSPQPKSRMPPKPSTDWTKMETEN